MNYSSRSVASFAAALCLCLASASFATAQTPAPTVIVPGAVASAGLPGSTTKPTSMELAVRAQQAFNRGEYATALPLLQKLEADAQGDTIKQAPIQERIRVCQRALDSLKANPAAAAAATQPSNDVTAEARTPHRLPKPGEVVELAIKELGNFEYNQEKGGGIPTDVVAMNGATIRMRGYMIPVDQAENITQFALVPSLFSCCLGQPPQIQHTVVVSCPSGKAVTYFPDEILVQGKLTVQEKKDEGYIVSIFDVQADSVKAAPK